MKNTLLVLFLAAQLIACDSIDSIDSKDNNVDPIQLHPNNQHYFLYKGKPLALISSSEHYGALINLDFDYRKYLKTLADDGMNYTRLFTGTYFEAGGDYFGIKHNTLGPSADKISLPWATDTTAKTKYDLSKWNNAYFSRLKDFMTIAADYDIIVEITLFSSFYWDGQWDSSPLNPINNINLTSNIPYKKAQILKDTSLYRFQEYYVRKMVRELNEHNNFFFEIQNEPWSDHPGSLSNIIVDSKGLNTEDSILKVSIANEESLQWQKQIALIIVDEEKSLDKKHLIAQNYVNYDNYQALKDPHLPLTIKAPIPEVDDNISIINLHYAGSGSVEWNYHHNKVIGFDETGFLGTEDIVYRRQAWRFMLSGGGLYNNLDYSFYVGHEGGLGKNEAPGGGSKTLRRQLKTLKDFLHGFELNKLQPNQSCISNSPELMPYVLSDKNNAFAIYIESVNTKNSILQIKTSNGSYSVQFINTLTGIISESFSVEVTEGILKTSINIPEGELAVKIIRE